MQQSIEIVLALGSNLGNRGLNLWHAVKELKARGINVLRHSSLYETTAAYVENQPSYLNAAVLATTALEPSKLLSVLKHIESKAGRDHNSVRFGPRPLDLDIVFYGSMKIQQENLVVPHPRWRDRAFVKAPVSDLYIPHCTSQSAEAADKAGSVESALRKVFAMSSDVGFHAKVDGIECAQELDEKGLLSSTTTSSAGCRGETDFHGSKALPQGQGDIMSRVTPLKSGRLLRWGRRTHLMGILNATPDSFSDGGKLLGSRTASGQDLDHAVQVAKQMVQDGADILDVGGQSTRPGSIRVSEQEEAARVIPLIRAMRANSQLKDVVLSCDTFSALVAQEAVAAGADIINDVSGGTLDKNMLPKVAELGVPYVLMHMRGDLASMQQSTNTAYSNTWLEVGQELQHAADRAMMAGVPAWNIILDPGIGFSKTPEGNLDLIRHLSLLRGQALQGGFKNAPMLVGPSRKSFLGKITGRTEPAERDAATVAAAVACIANGGLADIVRIHNVKDVRDGIAVADALYRGNETIS
ncbi:hypothetical protein CEUSTIGMA_g2989.t1 [Chlamydomonas eustigma]|uniref:Pterin-binding domain-containing protein n=1 Tax=Chlamydomonas eustigma TaxID=1157962 RepID=A0A250WXP0_9CHLO|nr:hypothetical protein CEUSTIGMA_g2989.t1 [Chlamydomonas eustigma]|eukprot:GAX75546.1 hypothetical protein CEUSTIGMA_g2989.t1 [Chlamydomonas eustigma]